MSAVVLLKKATNSGREIVIKQYRAGEYPTLWDQCTEAEREARRFATALARTKYNYTRSYLPPLPFSADAPKGEEFSVYYIALLVEPIFEVIENLKKAVIERLEMEIASDVQLASFGPWLQDLKGKVEKLEVDLGEISNGSVFGLIGDVRALAGDLKSFLEVVGDAPVGQALANVSKLPGDIRRIVTGFEQLIAETDDKDLLTTFL